MWPAVPNIPFGRRPRPGAVEELGLLAVLVISLKIEGWLAVAAGLVAVRGRFH